MLQCHTVAEGRHAGGVALEGLGSPEVYLDHADTAMEQGGRTQGLLPLLSIEYSHPGVGALGIVVLPPGAGGAGEEDISVAGNITGQCPGPHGELPWAGCAFQHLLLQSLWLFRYLACIHSFEDSAVKLLCPRL